MNPPLTIDSADDAELIRDALNHYWAHAGLDMMRSWRVSQLMCLVDEEMRRARETAQAG